MKRGNWKTRKAYKRDIRRTSGMHFTRDSGRTLYTRNHLIRDGLGNFKRISNRIARLFTPRGGDR